MKYRISTAFTIGFLALASLTAQAQTPLPGALMSLSRNVTGTVTNNSVRPGGCPTLICTTNMVTNTFCYTNCYWKLTCVTNATGQVQCTNTLVCTTRCFTNTFPQITCTNVFLHPTTLVLNQSLSGGMVVNDGCDELLGLFPSGSVFQALLYTTLRTNDWQGSHIGSFKILNGTNVLAFGSVSGINGGGSHRSLEPCAICNHLEGTLHGQVVQSGPLFGARIQAAYSGNYTDVTCPSATAPQGAISLGIEGTTVVPCFQFFPQPDHTVTTTTTTAE